MSRPETPQGLFWKHNEAVKSFIETNLPPCEIPVELFFKPQGYTTGERDKAMREYLKQLGYTLPLKRPSRATGKPRGRPKGSVNKKKTEDAKSQLQKRILVSSPVDGQLGTMVSQALTNADSGRIVPPPRHRARQDAPPPYYGLPRSSGKSLGSHNEEITQELTHNMASMNGHNPNPISSSDSANGEDVTRFNGFGLSFAIPQSLAEAMYDPFYDGPVP